jgi:hypothetical protein
MTHTDIIATDEDGDGIFIQAGLRHRSKTTKQTGEECS